MKKALGILVFCTLLLGGCDSGNAEPKQQEVVLTQQEQEQVKNNPNALASLLIRKAILEDMKNEKYTPEEQKTLDDLKTNVEIDYFLNHKAAETTFVNKEEVLAIYKENKSKIKGISEAEALAQIENQLYFQRREAEKNRYLNILIKKYDLNEKINEYSPAQKEENKQVAPEKKAEKKATKTEKK